MNHSSRLLGNRQMPLPILSLSIHPRFHRDRHDNDLALLQLVVPLPFGPTLVPLCLPTRDFSDNILTRPGLTGVAGVTGVTRVLTYTTADECRGNVSHPVSNKMLCVAEDHGDPRLLPGTPIATATRGTWFVTGLLSDGRLFTKLSRHLSWIESRLKSAEEHVTTQVVQYL